MTEVTSLPADAAELIEEAVSAYARQEIPKAEALLRQALELAPEAIEPRYHLSALCAAGGRYAKAAALLEPFSDDARVRDERLWFAFKAAWAADAEDEALRLAETLAAGPAADGRAAELLDFARQSGRPGFYWKLARRSATGDERRDAPWTLAAAMILRAVPEPFWRRAAETLAERLRRRGRWRKAKILLGAASLSGSRNPAWPRSAGQIHRITRDVYDPRFTREKACFEHALKLDPAGGEALEGLLLTLNDMNLWPELLRRLEALPAEDLSPPRRSMKAACLANLNRMDESAGEYAALERTELSGHARLCRGAIALETGRAEDALRLLDFEPVEHGNRLWAAFFRAAAKHRIERGADAPLDGQVLLDAMDIQAPPAFEGDYTPSDPGRCALCGSEGRRAPLWRDTRSGWVRARCPGCSMISVAPIPPLDEILELYKQPAGAEKSLYLHARGEVEELERASGAECRGLPYFNLLTDWGGSLDWQAFENGLAGEKRFLDIGCSAGKTVMLFRRCGWNAEGIDVDPDAVRFARSKGLSVHQGLLDDVEDRLSAYHFVTLVDVIEHVQDPAALLRRIRGLLEPGGLFYLKTPCADSLPHRFLGGAWLESCEHLHFFSRATLCRMLENAGFEILGIKQYLDESTPYLHHAQWKRKAFPALFERWISNTNCGDSIMLMAKKGE